MGDEEVIISKERKDCSHGGIHSVDPRLSGLIAAQASILLVLPERP